MYRLIDDIASRRLLYPAPVITVASVLVIDIPPERRGGGLSLGRYYGILLENDDEAAELDRFLTTPRDRAVAPDLLDNRPSSLRTDQLLLTRYEPPAVGWPWLSVCRWPTDGADPLAVPHEDMARGCYTMEMFETPSALEGHQAMLLSSLGRARTLKLRMIAADSLSGSGNC